MAKKTTVNLAKLKKIWNTLNREEKATYVAQLLATGGCSQQQIAKAVGESRHVIHRLTKLEPAEEVTPAGVIEDPKRPTEQHDVKNDSWTINLNQTRICTVDQLIEHCKVDTSIWDVERFVLNKWEVGAAEKAKSVRLEGKKGAYIGWERQETRIIVEPLFQVKCYLKKRVEVASAKIEIAALIEDAKIYAPVYLPIRHNHTSSGITVELSVPDLHLGKLAWGKETGAKDWDSKISRDTFFRAFEHLLQGVRGYNPDRFWFIVGNDFYNADGKSGLTTAGTPQPTDTRYPKMFRTGRQIVVEATDNLVQWANTDLIIVPGNHDELSCFHLGENLEIWYNRNQNVTVDNAPTLRKYRKHGKVGIRWTHGDKEKHSALPLLMATEQRKLWGDTRFNEIHLGHFHSTKVDEINGVRVRRLSSLRTSDEWHARMGYQGNLQSAEAFVWDADRGLVGTAVYNESPFEEQMAA